MEWSIPTDNLTGPRRIGGRESRRGFAFQDAYACLQISRLLDEATDIIGVRPEGAQDVDLLYSDGREEYIQIKDSPDERYKLAELRPILQSFAIDLIEAGRSSTIKFMLIARSNNIDNAVIRLRNRNQSPEDVTKIAELLAQSTQNSHSPQCLVKLSDAERYDLAAQLLKQIKFYFGMGDEFEGRLSFESHACSEMARHGVAGPKLQDAFNVLKAALNTTREFTRADVEELLKRFIGGAAIDLFEGRVEALTDDCLSHPASFERIQQFYSGAPLGWDIIAAHGDIERDQLEDLIKQLSHPSETLRLFCIVAEPGAGKSTFMRRVAAELHERYEAFLIRIRSKEDTKVWFLMQTFCQKVKRPFYILIDDVFRDPDVISALCELDQSLPITILATSRSHEYRTIRFGGKFERMSLKEPSPIEKERILLRLGKTRSDLTREQIVRMDNANQFLVLMMELKDPMGRRLEEIVQETVEWLQINDESAYRAYEYLCLAYLHSISIPASLLERLDPQGRFYNLPSRPKTQGLIFYDEDRTRNIRAGHPSIAEIAYSFYEKLRSPISVLSEIIDAVDASDYLERNFAGHLLRAMGQAKSPILASAFPRIEAFIASCKQYATISDFSVWRVFFLSLGQLEQAEKCVDAAMALAPINSMECTTLLYFHRERGKECDALPSIEKWIYEHPEDSFIRMHYLGLLERHGYTEEIKRALPAIENWIYEHPEDSFVRVHYLGLLERHGYIEEIKRALPAIENWIYEHPEDSFVRVHYLGLLERHGATEEEIKHGLQETGNWLANHPEEKEVWKVLIPILIRQGMSQEALEIATEAISYHEDDSNLMENYLRLIRESADENIVRKLWNRLIARQPNDPHHLIEFAAWLRDHNQYEESELLYGELIKIPKTKTTKKLMLKTHYGYGRLLMQSKRYLEAVNQFQQTLIFHKGHQMAHSWLATALRELGKLAVQDGRKLDANQYFLEAEKEFHQAIYWARVNKQPQAVFFTKLGWLCIDLEKYSDAVKSFLSAAKENPEFYGNYWGLGQAQMKLGQFQMAGDALCRALEKAPKDLQPPASVEIPELLRQCKNELNQNDSIDRDA